MRPTVHWSQQRRETSKQGKRLSVQQAPEPAHIHAWEKQNEEVSTKPSNRVCKVANPQSPCGVERNHQHKTHTNPWMDKVDRAELSQDKNHQTAKGEWKKPELALRRYARLTRDRVVTRNEMTEWIGLEKDVGSQPRKTTIPRTTNVWAKNPTH